MSIVSSSDLAQRVNEEFVYKLRDRAKDLQDLIDFLSARNERLEQFLSTSSEVPCPDPFIPTSIPPELLSRYLELRRKHSYLEQKSENLYAAETQLRAHRIPAAENLLRRRRLEEADAAVPLLSQTVGNLIGQRRMERTDPVILETTMVEKQLRAINDLNAGARPRSYGDIPINIDAEIAREEERRDRTRAEVEAKITDLSHALSKIFRKTQACNSIVSGRKRVVRAFVNFVKSYHSSKHELNNFPSKRIDEAISLIRQNADDYNANVLLKSLEGEREFLLEELRSRGISDPEMNEMKHEIDIRMIQLQHLTSVVGNALCRISTGTPPPDPVEKLKVEIAELELR